MHIESVLVIDRTALFGGAWPQGFTRLQPDGAAAILATVAARGRFEPRPAAEATPAWKQPIPYCILQRGKEWFCVERLRAQGEGRLHGLRSVGLGGHVGPEDSLHPDGPIVGALLRELAEELELGSIGSRRPTLLGLLNDDSNPVGQVHFGLVFGLQVENEETVVVRESLKMRGGFGCLAGQQGLWQDLDRFETWSRILLEAQAAGALAPFSPGPVASTGPQKGHLVDKREEATDG